MNRLRQRVSGYLIFSRWLILALLVGVSPNLSAVELAGTILAISGDVVAEQGGEQRRLERLSTVNSGDTVITGEGQVQLRFEDGALLTLYSDTRFVVDEYRYGSGKKSRAHFSLLKGLMHTLTGEMGKDNYKLKTRLANLGVRGTEFEVRLDNALLVSVHQGRVVVSNGGGSVEVPAGSSLRVTDRQGMPESIPKKLNMRKGQGGGQGGGSTPPPAAPPKGQGSGMPGGGGAGRWRWWSDTAWNP